MNISRTDYGKGNVQYVTVHVISCKAASNMNCNVLYFPTAIFGFGNVQLKRVPDFSAHSYEKETLDRKVLAGSYIPIIFSNLNYKCFNVLDLS